MKEKKDKKKLIELDSEKADYTKNEKILKELEKALKKGKNKK